MILGGGPKFLHFTQFELILMSLSTSLVSLLSDRAQYCRAQTLLLLGRPQHLRITVARKNGSTLSRAGDAASFAINRYDDPPSSKGATRKQPVGNASDEVVAIDFADNWHRAICRRGGILSPLQNRKILLLVRHPLEIAASAGGRQLITTGKAASPFEIASIVWTDNVLREAARLAEEWKYFIAPLLKVYPRELLTILRYEDFMNVNTRQSTLQKAVRLLSGQEAAEDKTRLECAVHKLQVRSWFPSTEKKKSRKPSAGAGAGASASVLEEYRNRARGNMEAERTKLYGTEHGGDVGSHKKESVRLLCETWSYVKDYAHYFKYSLKNEIGTLISCPETHLNFMP